MMQASLEVPDWIQGLSRQEVLTVCDAVLAQVNKALELLYSDELPGSPGSMQQQVVGGRRSCRRELQRVLAQRLQRTGCAAAAAQQHVR